MIAENVETPVVAETEHRSTFFRQSGWLMIANVAGGMLMWMVHFLSKAIPEKEYGVFGAFLTLAMLLPSTPLQMVVAQQTAKALALRRERELTGILRMFFFGASAVWLIGAVIVVLFQSQILGALQLTSATGLWITLPIILVSLWLPMLCGALQGQQNFMWLGWTMLSNGIGRITISALVVLLFTRTATGMITGVLMGLVVSSAIGAWQTRSLWMGASDSFDWRGLLRQIVPLMLGFFAFQILFTADTLFVKSYFTSEETGYYVSAGTLSRALMWLVLPLAAVMFPRIVHSAAKSEKTNLAGLVLAGTAVLAVVGAVGLALLGPLVIKVVYKASYVSVAASLLPWYAGAMVPLAVANVLLNDLLARSKFKIVPSLCVLVVGYVFALTRFHDSLVTVLKTLGVFNLLLLASCAWYTWRAKADPENGSAQVGA